MMRIFILCGVGLISILSFSANGRILNVPDQYETIQAGINASIRNDTVLIQPGIYHEHINYNKNGVTLGSLFLVTADTSNISSTIIDGDSTGCVIAISNEIDSTSIIIGITIRNGHAGYGGGIYIDTYSNPTIKNNKILNNVGENGGGIYCKSYSAIFMDNYIANNTAVWRGGGIMCEFHSPRVYGNIIINNHAELEGGGINVDNNCNALISENIISYNSAKWGAGIYLYSSTCVLTGNKIIGNIADSLGGGIGMSDYYHRLYGHQIINNVIDSNIVTANGGYGNGIYCFLSNPMIISNTIMHNGIIGPGIWGGGIYLCSSGGVVLNNSIGKNGANFCGGGLCIISNSTTNISGNIIFENLSLSGMGGGGIFISNSNISLINNIIYANLATYDAGVTISYSNPTLINNIIWANVPHQLNLYEANPYLAYCDIQDSLLLGPGNINSNPLFRNPNAGDFHLLSIECSDSANSPCIDTGHPDSIDAELNCLAGLGTSRSDMGAYGGRGNVTGIGHEDAPELPSSVILYPNYPNPFNIQTTISFYFSESNPVNISIFNLLGQKISTVYSGITQIGEHQVIWDATDFASGIYFARLETGRLSQSIKMILMK